MRATLCYVEEITHRQMRNESANVLRRVAGGEIILVTNNGQPAAVISPPPDDALALLAASGQLREAVDPPSKLRSIERSRSSRTTAEIVADVRGRW
jgi:prevent-host-death family protein